MREKFKNWRPQKGTLEILDKINAILEDYKIKGYSMTVRQIYYQLVARGHIDNDQAEYERIAIMIKRGREAGLMDWDLIEDRTRNVLAVPHFSSPSEAIRKAIDRFAIDKWHNQPYVPIVVVEKQALIDIVSKSSAAMDVRHTTSRGYPSASHVYSIARTLRYYVAFGKVPIILHLADLDPSGYDMSRDFADRIALYTKLNIGYADGPPAEVSTNFIETDILLFRLALNPDQVEKYNPPPNPAKLSDSRAKKFIRKFGRQSWELDSLDPETLEDLITGSIQYFLDLDGWETSKKLEAKGVKMLNDYFDNAQGLEGEEWNALQ